jgi:hypothetical protein
MLRVMEASALFRWLLQSLMKRLFRIYKVNNTIRPFSKLFYYFKVFNGIAIRRILDVHL